MQWIVGSSKAKPNTLLDLKMRPPPPMEVFDYMEEISGVNEAQLQHAMDSEKGLEEVHSALDAVHPRWLGASQRHRVAQIAARSALQFRG